MLKSGFRKDTPPALSYANKQQVTLFERGIPVPKNHADEAACLAQDKEINNKHEVRISLNPSGSKRREASRN